MIKAYIGDITKIKDVNYIVSSSNGTGPMGAGVAGAIRKAGGIEIQSEAFAVCKLQNPQPGDIYITKAGKLTYKYIFHLVTMKKPGGTTSYDIVRKCLNNLIIMCQMKNINKIALPALGVGVGNLDIYKVADIYIEMLTSSNIEFQVVDINNSFINYIINKMER